MGASKREPELSPEQQEALRASLPPDAPDLGAIRALHRRKHGQPAVGWIACAFALILAITLLVMGLNAEPQSDDRIPLFILSGLFFAGTLAAAGWAIFLMADPSRSAPEDWLLCENGLLRHRGKALDVFLWDKLKIRKTVANPLGRHYELSGHGGEGPIVLKVGPLAGGMIHAIEKAQVRRARPGMLRAITAGETVKFGKVGVSAQGLVYGKSVTPWDSIKSLDFSYDQQKTQQLFLTVPVRGGPDLNLNASEELANIWLFMEVVSKVHPRLEKHKDSQDSWLL
jgi:hypothetical protein